MRERLLVVVLLGAVLAAPQCGPAGIPLIPDHPYSFAGWGTSLAWWANVVGGWSNAAGSPRTQLLDALFDPPRMDGRANDSLGLTVLRYNLGAGPSQAHRDPTKPGQAYPCPARLRPGGMVPVLQTAGGVWNIEADGNQIGVLQEARARGADLLEAFANSPPAWMTISGCSIGNTRDLGANNLAPERYRQYADYLTGALTRLKAEKGLAFQTVEPFNEPHGFAWGKPCGEGCQEGANFDEKSQSAVIGDLCDALAQSGLPTEISAPDANQMPNAVSDYRTYGTKAQGCVHQVNAHGYGSNDGLSTGDGRKDLAGIGRRVWMSEVGHAGGAQDIDQALKLSREIIGDLQDLRPQAWVYWQALEEPGPGHWGLLEAPFSGNAPPMRTKRFSVVGQYSRFIRPRYEILHAQDPGSLTVVARDPASGTVVIVGTNDTGGERSVSYDLSKLGHTSTDLTVYRTTGTGNLSVVANPPKVEQQKIVDRQPPSSVTTYLLGRPLRAAPPQRN